MPTPPMTPAAQAAYDKALGEIEACRRKGKAGTTLNLSGLDLTQLPPEIGHLSALKTLYLFKNQLSTLPPEIGQLKALTVLGLDRNQLSTLPPEIGQLTALRELRLHSNQLSTLPPEIGQLTALTELYLDNNQLNALPPEIGQLTALMLLSLHNNRLSTLPPEIGQLTALVGLILDDNQLRTLPTELGQLTALKVLHLFNNQLRTLPTELGQLTALKVLHLSNNQLSALPPEIGQLTALTRLSLDSNQLSALPPEIGQLTALTDLFLHENPGLGLPASVLGPTLNEVYSSDDKARKAAARPADILNYYFSQREAQRRGTSQPVNEVKVMLVGRGGAGKTSLRRFFTGLPHNKQEDETPGIALDDFTLACGGKDIRVHLWDFAGQEITHALHQFFLTEGCVYVLVLDPRSNTEMKDALYWLELLKRYAPGAPVVVALNRQDARHGGYDVDRLLLKKRFPTLAAFVPTNCETRDGCGELRSEICAVIEALPETQPPHQTVPAPWLAVKEQCFVESQGKVAHKTGLLARLLRLAGYGEERPQTRRAHLTLAEFRQICSTQGETDPGKQESLARLLNQLGAVLHFVDDPRLRDTSVLNPHWVTDAVYRLLRAREGDHSDGVLSMQDAQRTLPGETEETVRYLLRLMERFELCFPLGEDLDQPTTRWLVPAALGKYLPAAVGDEWQKPGAVRMRYVYDPLPEGVIPRFIVATHRLSEGQPRWRYGVVLRDGAAAALVQRGDKENHLEVHAFGEENDRLRLLEIIQGNLERINADVPKPEPYAELELAGVPGEYRRVSDLEAAELGKQQVAVKTADGDALVQPTPQLNRTTEQASRNPERVPLSLFLSYSHKDKTAKTIFQENLTVMGKKRLITAWNDGLIEPGTLWREEIMSKLESMDIFVGLLTNAFIASDFIETVEVAAAKKRLEEQGRDFLFVLILVDDIPLTDLDLAAYQIMKPGGKAVCQHSNRKAGFTQAQRELEELIKTRQEAKKEERQPEREAMRPAPSKPQAEGVTYINVHGDYNAGDKIMRDKNPINIGGNVTNSQVGQTLTNCTNMIQQQAPGELKTLLTELEQEVRALLAKLPEEKREETAGNLELLTKAVTSTKPNRAWYSVSSEGLLEASKWVKDFTGNIAGTVGKLTKLLWPS